MNFPPDDPLEFISDYELNKATNQEISKLIKPTKVLA